MSQYLQTAPSLGELQAVQSPLLLEFGTHWCGHCQAAQFMLQTWQLKHPEVQVLHILDGKGKALGRHFRVKLWPTFILLQQGQEIGRSVRPNSLDELARQLAGL